MGSETLRFQQINQSYHPIIQSLNHTSIQHIKAQNKYRQTAEEAVDQRTAIKTKTKDASKHSVIKGCDDRASIAAVDGYFKDREVNEKVIYLVVVMKKENIVKNEINEKET